MSSLADASNIQWQATDLQLHLSEMMQVALGVAGTTAVAVLATCTLCRRALALGSTPPAAVASNKETPLAAEADVVAHLAPKPPPPAPSRLDGAAGVEQLLADGFSEVFNKTALSQPGGPFPKDHLFRTLVGTGMIEDQQVFFKSARVSRKPSSVSDDASAAPDTQTSPPPTPQAVLVGAYALGQGACGHVGVAHGGVTALLCDESLGELLYIAKMKGAMSFKYVVTASLEVSYKQPWAGPARAPVYVTAYVSEVQGRKVWVEAVVADAPLTQGLGAQVPEGCSVYATAKALFLDPRPEGSSSAALQKAAEGRADVLGGV